MNTTRRLPRPVGARIALALALVVTTVAACGAGSTPSSPPTAAPTPTPIIVGVETPEDAAALVLATDQRFQGVTKLNPDIIGASAWWTSEPRNGGGFVITVTIGWGDCPAGCISRHVWTYEVTGDGRVTLTGETGDPMPDAPLQP